MAATLVREMGPSGGDTHHDQEPAFQASWSSSSLGLGLRAKTSTWLATLALAIYTLASMARDLSLYDSGELALAAVQLGLGHPPGQPLHTLLAGLAARLPLPALIGVNALSALPAALTLIPATSLAQAALGRRAAPAAHGCVAWLIASTAVHPSLWEPATRSEVYALATLCAVWSVARAVTLAAQRLLPGLGVGVALGLCASANPAIALITGLALLPWLLWCGGALGLERIRCWGAVALGAGLGLLPYIYLPIAAARSDVMVWGEPHDFASYWRYLTLRDYAHNQHIDFGLFASHLADWCGWALQHGLAPVIGLGLLAASIPARSAETPAALRAVGPIILVLSLCLIASNAVWHVEIPDYDGYMASALWLSSALACASCLRLIGAPAGNRSHALRALGALSIVALLAVALLTDPSPWARTRAHDQVARSLAKRVLFEAPARALVITETDALAGALLYLQGAEHVRKDVSILVYGLASSSWHWQQLFRAHPELERSALQGAGGRAGRVRRLLDANPDRPALFERLDTAQQVGTPVCAGGLYLRSGASCARARAQDPEAARLLARLGDRVGDGSPGAAAVLALVSYELGEALWRLGDARSAHDVLLAGVPAAERPARAAGLTRALSAAPAAHGALRFTRPAALGDSGRNLFLAGAIVAASGEQSSARAYLQAAASTGLPEARAMLHE